MVFRCRLWSYGRCCAALLAWLLGLVALPAIGPELPSTDDQVVAPAPAVNEELPAQRLVVLIAHRPQAPPAGLEAAAASSFSQPVVVIVATYDYDGTRVRIRGYVGTSDPVNSWDPSGLFTVRNGLWSVDHDGQSLEEIHAELLTEGYTFGFEAFRDRVRRYNPGVDFSGLTQNQLIAWNEREARQLGRFPAAVPSSPQLSVPTAAELFAGLASSAPDPAAPSLTDALGFTFRYNMSRGGPNRGVACAGCHGTADGVYGNIAAYGNRARMNQHQMFVNAYGPLDGFFPNYQSDAYVNGPLHYGRHAITIDFSNSGLSQEQAVETIYNRMKTFEDWGDNSVATIEVLPWPDESYRPYSAIAYFHAGLANEIGVAAGNARRTPVGISYDPDNRTVIGRTMGRHMLLGERRWQVSAEATDDGFSVIVMTHGFERTSGLPNTAMFWTSGLIPGVNPEEDQVNVWSDYLRNIAAMASTLRGYNRTGDLLIDSESIWGGDNPWIEEE